MSSKEAGRPNYAFFGTPDFAAIILKKLIESGLPPVAVVCNPDRPVGRKKLITPPPVKQLIMNQEARIRDKIKILQPEKLDRNFRDSLFGLRDSFDLFVVTAYAKIIPKEIIEIPRLGTIGIHPSLLPRHRGASPIQSAILVGNKTTGVTLYLLDEKTDHGPILTGRELGIEKTDNYRTLEEKLARLGAELATEAIPAYASGKIQPEVQNEEYATYTEKFETKDAFVELEKDSPIETERKVRALNPEPGVWTMKEGKRMKILEAELRDGTLVLKKIQFEGKKPQIL